jgi:antitoxin VapB
MVDFSTEVEVLNIKNPEAYRLARLIAARTGESLTAAVTIALEERLRRITAHPRVTAEELLAIGRACARNVPGATISIDEYLYDHDGLPK